MNLLGIEPKIDIDEESQISRSEQLLMLQELKRIDYQNSLVMRSLEEYTLKFEQLKKEQTNLLDDIRKQVETLKDGNKMFDDKMEYNISTFANIQKTQISALLTDANNILSETKTSLNQGLNGYLEKINLENEEFLNKCEERKRKLFKKWTVIDYMILADLLVLTVSIAILVYKAYFI